MGRQLADHADGIDIGLLVRRALELVVHGVGRIGFGIVAVVVLEAHVQRVGRRLLDAHGERGRGDLVLRRHVVHHALHWLQAHAVFDHQLAVAQAAAETVVGTLVDDGFVQLRHEQLGRFGAQHQAAPQLFDRQGVEQRVERVVDFDKVFKFHG